MTTNGELQKAACLKEYSKHEAEDFTKFYATPPAVKKDGFYIRTVVEPDLQPKGDVIVLVRKGVRVHDAIKSMVFIATLLEDARKQVRIDKKRIEDIMARRNGGFAYLLYRVKISANMVFGLPFGLISKVLDFVIRGYKNER